MNILNTALTHCLSDVDIHVGSYIAHGTHTRITERGHDMTVDAPSERALSVVLLALVKRFDAEWLIKENIGYACASRRITQHIAARIIHKQTEVA